MLSGLRLDLSFLPIDWAYYGLSTIRKVIQPWVKGISVPVSLLLSVLYYESVLRIEGVDG